MRSAQFKSASYGFVLNSKEPITTWTQLLNWRENLIDVWNWFLWCGNEIQVLSQVFLKTSTLYAVTPEVTKLIKRKYWKRCCVFPARGKSWNKNSEKWKSCKFTGRWSCCNMLTGNATINSIDVFIWLSTGKSLYYI